VEEVAGHVGLGERQLTRAFLRELCQTPHAYVVNLRVEHARGLLRAGVGVDDAALASGFCDRSHLSRHFTRRHGIGPGAYRAA